MLTVSTDAGTAKTVRGMYATALHISRENVNKLKQKHFDMKSHQKEVEKKKIKIQVKV